MCIESGFKRLYDRLEATHQTRPPETTADQQQSGRGDTAKGPTSLRVENYAHGSDAALDSWVVLERKEGGAGGAE